VASADDRQEYLRLLNDMADWTTEVIARLGYLGVALLVALENVFPPIPSEIVLPFAGFVARDGDANLVAMIAAATAGSMVGAWVLYGVSAAVGPDRLHGFLVRYGRWLRLDSSDIVRAELWFDRRSSTAVLICRCVPLIRSLISIPAGFRRMPLVRFTVFTMAGSLVWNAALIGAGYGLRSQWDRVEGVISWFQYIVIAAVVAAVGWFVFVRPRRPVERSSDVDRGRLSDDRI
jgi:membrane protein DedA with SNARE-associated domain